MKVSPAVIRALPTTLAVYIIYTALSLTQTTALGFELERALPFAAIPWSGRAATFEALTALAPLFRVKALDGVIALLGAALLGPWLQMAWLTALAEPCSPTRALSRAWPRYARALFASLWVGLIAVVACAPWLLLAYAGHGYAQQRLVDRVHDVLVLCALAPLLPTLLWLALVHDLARAGCLERTSFASVLRAVRLGRRLGLLVSFTLWLAVSTGAALTAILLPWITTQGALTPWLALALAHGCLLMRAVLRSAWLAKALDAQRSPET